MLPTGGAPGVAMGPQRLAAHGMVRHMKVSPCPAEWSKMTPVEGGRHCSSCDRVVSDTTHGAPFSTPACVRAWRHRDGRLWLGALRGAALVALAACAHAPLHPEPAKAAQVCALKSEVPAGQAWFEVVDESGLGIPGTLVNLGDQSATTDADGRAVFSNITTTRLQWRVEHSYFGTAGGEVDVPADRGVGLSVAMRLDDVDIVLGGITSLSPTIDTERAARGRTYRDLRR